MKTAAESSEKVTLLKIQNTQRPEQEIYLTWDEPNNLLVTEGLKDLFKVKEIRIGVQNMMDVIQSLEDYAQVLSFLVESMSTAEDLHLPYGYQNEFDFQDKRYTLLEEGDYRVLRPVSTGPATG